MASSCCQLLLLLLSSHLLMLHRLCSCTGRASHEVQVTAVVMLLELA